MPAYLHRAWNNVDVYPDRTGLLFRSEMQYTQRALCLYQSHLLSKQGSGIRAPTSTARRMCRSSRGFSVRSIRTLRLPSSVVDACDRHLRQENYNPSRDAALSEATPPRPSHTRDRPLILRRSRLAEHLPALHLLVPNRHSEPRTRLHLTRAERY